jgi:hypothetical protein
MPKEQNGSPPLFWPSAVRKELCSMPKEQNGSPPLCWPSADSVIPYQVWNDISMDFIEGFPKVGGKSVILMVVDRFLKFAHFIPLSHPYSASTVVKAFFDNIVQLHDMPCSVISDHDLIFTSTF